MADIDNLKGGTKRTVDEESLDNLRGGTQRVIQVNSLNNLRGGTQRVYVVGGGGSAPVIDELNVTPSTSAQTITAPSGVDGYSPVNVSAVDSTIDANIQPGNIKDGVSILGVTGTCVELNGETKTITPQTYGQTIYPTNPKNGITEITVNAVTSSIDANITAGNIKKDVQILGVTGSYEGVAPSGTKSITTNGVHDVAGYANADVQVPTTAPAHYVEKTVDANGKLQNSTTIINLNGVTDIGYYVLAYAYYYTSSPANTSADLSGLTTISGSYACYNMCAGCTWIISVDLSSLTTISGGNACDTMFGNCTGITTIDLSSLTTLSGENACYSMFTRCTGLTSVDLSSLTTISGRSACQQMFRNCTSLATVYIGGTTAINFGTYTNQFNNMFYGCTQNIDVYAPAANQTQIEAFSGYPNFGATGNVVWHWRS